MQPLVELDHVNKHYGELHVLNDIDVTIPKGQVVAADVAGEDLLGLQAAGALAGPTAWLFGNEARGLDQATLALADRAARLPVYGHAESLNLATAASVCLYQSAFAQRAV